MCDYYLCLLIKYLYWRTQLNKCNIERQLFLYIVEHIFPTDKPEYVLIKEMFVNYWY
jgi:hypothetical protein